MPRKEKLDTIAKTAMQERSSFIASWVFNFPEIFINIAKMSDIDPATVLGKIWAGQLA